MPKAQEIMSKEQFDAAIGDLADDLLEQHGDCAGLALIGIQRRGVNLAERLNKHLAAKLGHTLPLGTLDITLYRDDWTTKAKQPTILKTDIPFSVDDVVLILVDDVLYTGRTVRAALEALADFGRPRRVELMVLVDRGHRELPIHADYVAMTLPTAEKDRVDVQVQEYDGMDQVRLVRLPQPVLSGLAAGSADSVKKETEV